MIAGLSELLSLWCPSQGQAWGKCSMNKSFWPLKSVWGTEALPLTSAAP